MATKIKGITVGTTQKPESVLLTAVPKLTDQQKTQFISDLGLDNYIRKTYPNIVKTDINADGDLVFYYSDSTQEYVGNIMGPAGVGISEFVCNDDGELVVRYTNGDYQELGSIIGPRGETGEQGPQGPAGPIGPQGLTPFINNLGNWQIGDIDTGVKAAPEEVNLSNYVVKEDIADFITAIPDEYVTETELAAKGYITEHQDISGKADTDHTHKEYLTNTDLVDITPSINADGNWQIGDNDTGVKAEGIAGTIGDSAYDIAKKNGFDGTEEEWLESLKGETRIVDGISSASINDDGQLIVTYSGCADLPLGNVIGPKGNPGYGVSDIKVDDSDLQITFTNDSGDYVTKEDLDDKGYLTDLPEHNHDSLYIRQDTFVESDMFPGCFYRELDNGFKEWRNPPMSPDIEYLTNEYYCGEQVWTKLVELGKLPKADTTAGGVKTVDVIGAGTIFWMSAWLFRPSDNTIMPVPTSTLTDGLDGKIYAYGTNISIGTYNNKKYDANFVVRALIKFIRPGYHITKPTKAWEIAMLKRIDKAMLPMAALAEIPKSNSGVHSNGTILTGINYSGVTGAKIGDDSRSAGRLVGTGTSLSTYYSTLENPASITYTSGDVDTERDGVSSYYGINCSGFACYAMGLTDYIGVNQLANYEVTSCKYKMRVLLSTTEYETADYTWSNLQTDSAKLAVLKEIRRGDLILNQIVRATKNDEGITVYERITGSSDHVKVVKDVCYDKYGNLCGFYVAESAKPFVKITFMTPTMFMSQMAEAQPYSIIRVDDSTYGVGVEEISYSKSVYPNMGDGGVYTKGKYTGSSTARVFAEYGVNTIEATQNNVTLYIPDEASTILYIKNLTKNGDSIAYKIANRKSESVNGVTVYKMPFDADGYGSTVKVDETTKTSYFCFPAEGEKDSTGKEIEEYIYEIWVNNHKDDPCRVVLRRSLNKK